MNNKSQRQNKYTKINYNKIKTFSYSEMIYNSVLKIINQIYYSILNK